LIILSLLAINPLKYLKNTIQLLIFPFTSPSTARPLPLNLQTQTKPLRVPHAIPNFSATFPLSVAQNDCAPIYP
ncbi:cation:dicarboxylate symporter family transporter, partial [Staphylococcus epidermidis]|uniref:cation:dicarboxylate symporter family transporter n=1 Tax=Staphylococcus epidermidis TaxID=1282 RepID=UPI0011A2C5A3